ncbi:MAG: hypothetical protein M5T52_19255 [Ignavibacteriaceae bacterium]|nr:hypothetical protein [Ignavibacteriaceae bacterium]
MNEIFVDAKSSRQAQKGDEITLITSGLVRRNDRVYLVEELK